MSRTLPTPRLFSLNLVQVGQLGFVEEVCLTVLLLARLVNLGMLGLGTKNLMVCISRERFRVKLWRQYGFNDFAIMQRFEAALPFGQGGNSIQYWIDVDLIVRKHREDFLPYGPVVAVTSLQRNRFGN